MGSFAQSTGHGALYLITTTPVGWKDGDLWSDLSEDPPHVKLNNNGTAIDV